MTRLKSLGSTGSFPDARRVSRLFGVISLLLATSCNVVEFRREGIRRALNSAGLREHVVTLGDDTISYWDGGSGLPVVLLHGFGMAALWQWSEQVATLAASRRVIMPDLLWFGGSSSTRPEYTLEHQGAAVSALLDHLGLPSVDLVGVSYGGFIAYELVSPRRLHHGRGVDMVGVGKVGADKVGVDRVGVDVRSLTFVDSPGPVFTRADHDALLERLGVADLAEVFIPANPKAMNRLMALAYNKPPFLPSYAGRLLIEEGYTHNRNELRALLSFATGNIEELTSSTRRISQPTCMIWGREDPIFPVALMDRLQAVVDGRTSRHVIEGARHAPNAEYPEQFNRALMECLAGRGQ